MVQHHIFQFLDIDLVRIRRAGWAHLNSLRKSVNRIRTVSNYAIQFVFALGASSLMIEIPFKNLMPVSGYQHVLTVGTIRAARFRIVHVTDVHILKSMR